MRRPRVRNLDERFVSRILPLFQRRTPEVAHLLPELYLHGLATGDFTLALRGLLGEGAPLSASSVQRLTEDWQRDDQRWQQRDLSALEPVYVWADGIYGKAGLESTKAALRMLIAGLADGSKVVLAVDSGHRESTESWAEILRDLTARGLCAPASVIADGAVGLWSAVAQVWPYAAEQRCWNHKLRNVVDAVPPSISLTCRRRCSASRRQNRWRTPNTTGRRSIAHTACAFPRRAPGSRLGAHAHVLSVSEGALAASPHHECRRVALCGGAAADECSEALQESRARDGDHLALAARR